MGSRQTSKVASSIGLDEGSVVVGSEEVPRQTKKVFRPFMGHEWFQTAHVQFLEQEYSILRPTRFTQLTTLRPLRVREQHYPSRRSSYLSRRRIMTGTNVERCDHARGHRDNRAYRGVHTEIATPAVSHGCATRSMSAIP